jgi:hypothetical protein
MIRVHRVTELADGSLEIMIHGGLVEAEYVSGTLRMSKGVEVLEPALGKGAPEFVYVIARGTAANPFTRDSALRSLRGDERIEVIE